MQCSACNFQKMIQFSRIFIPTKLFFRHRPFPHIFSLSSLLLKWSDICVLWICTLNLSHKVPHVAYWGPKEGLVSQLLTSVYLTPIVPSSVHASSSSLLEKGTRLETFVYLWDLFETLGLVYRSNPRLTASDRRLFDHPGSLLGLIWKLLVTQFPFQVISTMPFRWLAQPSEPPVVWWKCLPLPTVPCNQFSNYSSVI